MYLVILLVNLGIYIVFSEVNDVLDTRDLFCGLH